MICQQACDEGCELEVYKEWQREHAWLLISGWWYLSAIGGTKTSMIVAAAIVQRDGDTRGCWREDIRMAAVGGGDGWNEDERDLSFIGGIRGAGDVYV